MIEFFEHMIIPTTTHNSLEIRKSSDGRKFIGKSAELIIAEKRWQAYIAKHQPKKPLTGAISAKLTFCFEAKNNHKVGDPKTTKPDLDNLEKTFWDVCENLGFFAIGDQQIVQKLVTKAYSDVPGVYLKLEEVR